MKLKKWMITGCACVLTAALLAGCGNNAETTQEKASQEQSSSGGQPENKESSTIVMVTAIDGNEITGNLMMHSPNQGGGAPNEGQDGEMPEKPEGEAPSGEEGEMPEKPEGEAPSGEEGEMPERPEGEAPSGEEGEMPERPEGEAPSGEKGEMQSVSFTITEDTKITQESEDGTVDATVEDIQVDSMIQVELNDDNEAESIIIKKIEQKNSSDKKQKESAEE